MKKSFILLLVLAMVLPMAGIVPVGAEAAEVTMTVSSTGDAGNVDLGAVGRVTLSNGSDWSASSNPGVSGPGGEQSISSTKVASASFVPNNAVLTPGYYKVDFYKILFGGNYARPVIKFDIYHNGKHDYEVFNLNEEPTAEKKEWMDLGVYYFNGDGTEYVMVTNNTASLYARVSSVKFTPSAVAAEREADRGGILVTGTPIAANDTTWPSTNAANHPRLVTARGENTYWTSQANVFVAYSAETVPEAGYYDVYFYKIVYNAASNANAKIYIHHDGRQDTKEINYSGLSTYTTVWEKLGTYYFSGNAANEYISVENTVKGQTLRIGGVKFVRNHTPAEGYQEVIVRAQDTTHVSANGTWKDSGAVKADDGSTNTKYCKEYGARFTYFADQLTAGTYKVYYYRTPHTPASEDNNVWMTVNHSGKTDAFSIDYSVGEREWVYVGKYDFAGGSQDEGVTVMRVQPGEGTADSSTRATAVKFVKNDPEEADTFVVSPAATGHGVVLKDDKVGLANLKGGNGSNGGVTTSVNDLVYEGVFSNYFAANGYRRYYLPTSGAKPGTYEVYAAATPHTDGNDTQIQATVCHSGVTEKSVFDGSREKGYYKIGEFEFDGRGSEEYVELKKTTSDPNIARVGAVKFVRQEDVTPPSGKAQLVRADFGAVRAVPGTDGLKLAASDYGETKPLKVRAVVYNDSIAAMNPPVLYAAVYSDDACTSLKDIVIINTTVATIGASQTAYYIGEIPARVYTAGERVKMFIWNGEMKPIDTIPSIIVSE